MKQDQKGLAPRVNEAIQQAIGVLSPALMSVPELDDAALEQVLRKEGICNAACCAAYELFDYVDFTAWLHNSLLSEICAVSAALQTAAPLRRFTFFAMRV